MANSIHTCLFFITFLLLSLVSTEARTQPNIYQRTVKSEDSSSVEITFRLEKHVEIGQGFVIAGNISALGSWDTANALLLNYSETDVWSATVSVPSESSFESKAARVVNDTPSQVLEWYNGDIFTLLAPSSHSSATVLLDWCSSSSSLSISNEEEEMKMRAASSSEVVVQFQLKKKVEIGQVMGILGNQTSLGNWNQTHILAIDYIVDDLWLVDANGTFHSGLALAYKAVIVDYWTDKLIKWMPGSNRRLGIPSDTKDQLIIIPVSWNQCPIIRHQDTILSELESFIVI